MKKLFIVLGLCLLVAGCSIFPKPQPPQINYFSIGVPNQPMIKKRLVKVQVVNSLTGYHKAIYFKTGTGKLKIDQFNRWIAAPATQVQRYLTVAMATKMSASDSRAPLIMTTQLLTFDCNLIRKTANLTLLVTIKEKSKVQYKQMFIEKVYVDGNTATAYANAMSRAMHNIAVKLAEKINKLK